MTREERIDWLCRLRSNIQVYMPKEWVANMETALSEAIDSLREDIDAYVLCGKEKEKHEMAIAALENENFMLDKVLKIINSHIERYITGHINATDTVTELKCATLFAAAESIRTDVIALRGDNE